MRNAGDSVYQSPMIGNVGAGRVERREVRLEVIVRADEARVRRVEDEGAEDRDDDDRFDPPEIGSLVRAIADLDR